MKKLLVLTVSFLFVFALAACGGTVDEGYEIAMITDVGDIDDESFNQGTWEGIEEYALENNITHEYYQPTNDTPQAYLDAIELAIENGAEIVVTPGFLFEEAIYQAQELYPDTFFVLLDGMPHDGDWANGPDFHVAENTVSIFYAEHEAGFLAGYAAVMDGYESLGYMGGMAVPAVIRFGIGYVAGVYYAAAQEDITISFPNNRYSYLGNFEPSDEHKNAALNWYNGGTEIIFAAAGGAGSSVMSAASDTDNMMIGVDVDQSGNSSTVLTSAMKGLAVSVQLVLEDYYAGNFPGGQVITYDAATDGVGLPTETASWRFDTFTVAQYDAIFNEIADGTVSVPETYAELVAFFAENDLGDLVILEGNIAPE